MTAAELMVKVGADVDGAVSGLNKVHGTVGKVSTGTKVAMGVMAGGIIAGLGAAVHSAADFESSLNTLQAVSGASSSVMGEVGAKATALGNDMTLPATSAKDAADAMTELTKGGLTVAQSMDAAKGVLQLSAAAQIDNADAATITARALNSFGMAGKDAGKVADLLAATSNASTAEITDLAQGMQMASSVFKMGSQPIETLTTSLGLMANAGVSGSDAGTSLKTMMMRLQAPTKDAAGALKHMGINVRDAGGHMLPMRNIVSQFSDATKGMTDAQRDAAFSTIFGADAIRAANIVLAGGTEKWDKMHDSTTKGGEAADLAAAKMKGLNGAIEGISSMLETLGIMFGTMLTPSITTAVKAMQPLLTVFQAHADLVATIAAPLIAMAAAIGIVVGAVKAWAIAQELLNLAMLENPVGLIIVLLVGLGVALVEAYTHCAKFREIVNAAFAAIKSVALPVLEWLRSEAPAAFHAVLSAATSAWNAIKSVTTAVWGQISGVVMAVWAVIKAYVTTEINVIRNVIAAVMAAIHGDWSGAWDKLKAAAGAALTGAVAVIKAILTQLVPAVLSLALRAGIAIVTGIGKGLNALEAAITGQLAKIPGLLMAAAAAAGEAAVAIGRAIINGVLNGVSGLGEALKGKVEGMLHGVLSHIDIPGFSPPDHAAAEAIGKPLGRGTIEGFLMGSADLPDKIGKSVKAALEAGRNAVQAAQSTFTDAFSRLGDDAMRAFDARTDAMMGQLSAKFDRMRSMIAAQGARLTPGEKALNAFRDDREAMQRQADYNKASSDLAAAQAAGDLAAAADAQERLRQLTLDAQDRLLEAQAEKEREARDKATAVRQAALDKKQKEAELNLTAERELLKRHLQDQLDDLEANLEKRHISWQTAHKKLMGMFKGEFGPNMRTAGKNLGKAFAEGLEESFAHVEKSARAVAQLVAKYLQLHSPAERGPLSSLDTWWKALGPTLLGGVDVAGMESQLAGQLAGVQGAALSGGSSSGSLLGVALSAGGAGGGGGVTWTGDLVVNGNAWHTSELVEEVRTGLLRTGKRNGGGILGGLA